MDREAAGPETAETSRVAAGSVGWWDSRSRLDPLAAVLDPAEGAEAKNRHIDRVHRKALLRALEDGGRLGRALDFGCGTGRLSAVLAPRADVVTGVDISEEMVTVAREVSRYSNVEFLTYDGTRLPFDDATFDTAVSCLVLQMYCDEPARFHAVAADLARTLRPRATLWLIERAGAGDAAAWTPDRWRDELARAGLELASVRPVRHGTYSPIARLVLRGVVPDRALDAAAGADAALTVRRGIRDPYTEALMRVVRR